MKIKLTKSKFVGFDEVPYIVAEIGSNHNGNLSLAKKLIESAKRSGVDCVKFQSFTENSLFSSKCYQIDSKLKRCSFKILNVGR